MFNLSHVSAVRKTLAVGSLMASLATGVFAQTPATTTPAALAVAPSTPPKAAPKPSSKRLSDSLNADLPKWLSFNGEYRFRFEGIGGLAYKPSNSDAWGLSRLRINTTIKASPWLRLYIQAQDAEVGGRNAKPDGPPFEDRFDVRQGYVELGSPESGTAAIKVGRQELAFGEQRLVGHLNWTNTARTFDAVKFTLRNKKARVDIFSSSVVTQFDGPFDKSGYGNYFHGAYGVLTGVLPKKGNLEPYAFWRAQNGVKSEGGPTTRLNAATMGFRAAGKFTPTLDYSIESAGQFGGVAADEVRAWAGHANFTYNVPTKSSLKPKFFVEYNYASGDNNPTDGRRETFDQLYPTGHDKNGLADQVGWKNIEVARTGLEFKLTPKVTVTGAYLSYWLADVHDALYAANGTSIAKVVAGTAGRHVGQEADIQLVYAFNALTQFSGGFGNIFPGQFLKTATPGQPYRFTYVQATYQF